MPVDGAVRAFSLLQLSFWIKSFLTLIWIGFYLSVIQQTTYMQTPKFSSVQSCLTLRSHRPQPVQPPCPSPTTGVYSNSWLLSRWCHPTISIPIVPFSRLQSFPASGSFPVSHFLTSGGQSIGSFSFSISPSNEYSGLISFRTGWISLQSKGLSRVFSNTTVQKHQFFSTQLSL